MEDPLLAIDWFVGTMGFSYKDWSGPFYPADLPGRDYLGYYSRVFNAVEIDSTFYGTPRATTVEKWLAATPPGFKFCLKTPRLITHDLKLVGTEGLMAEFVQTVSRLDDKLGAILIQFPPSFRVDQIEILAEFLAHLPEGPAYAVEIRDRSWYKEAASVEEMLHARRVAWAATAFPGLPVQLANTSGFLYIRWIGQHGSFERHTQEQIDRLPELEEWQKRLRAWENPVDRIYGFFNNDFSGFAAQTALRFKKFIGLPDEPNRPPQQPRLF